VNLAALGLVIVQSLSGAAIVFDEASLWTTLTHAGLMALLFTCLADGCYQLVPKTRGRERRQSVPRRAQLSSS
jgi:heme A synthase